MIEQLQAIGLSKLQATAYVYLLDFVNGRRPAQIAKDLSLTRTNAYKILDSLHEIRLVRKSDASKKLILVIDDDPDATYLLRENLGPEEFEIIGARNGIIGQEKARELKPDAILLDILMPEKDGWQVLHDLKNDPATTNIPIILLTIVDKKALGMRLGAAAYLLKPLNPAEVLSTLQKVI